MNSHSCHQTSSSLADSWLIWKRFNFSRGIFRETELWTSKTLSNKMFPLHWAGWWSDERTEPGRTVARDRMFPAACFPLIRRPEIAVGSRPAETVIKSFKSSLSLSFFATSLFIPVEIRSRWLHGPDASVFVCVFRRALARADLRKLVYLNLHLFAGRTNLCAD